MIPQPRDSHGAKPSCHDANVVAVFVLGADTTAPNAGDEKKLKWRTFLRFLRSLLREIPTLRNVESCKTRLTSLQETDLKSKNAYTRFF